MAELTGACMCGAVRFEVGAPLLGALYRHWLYMMHPENRDLIAVRMGALDQDPGVRPGVHQFVTYAAPWGPIPDDGLPRFPERMGETEPLA